MFGAAIVEEIRSKRGSTVNKHVVGSLSFSGEIRGWGEGERERFCFIFNSFLIVVIKQK